MHIQGQTTFTNFDKNLADTKSQICIEDII